MKCCPIEKLVEENFNTVFINALQQFWHTTKSFHCIGKPKKQNLLLYLSGCRITYTDKDGNTLTAGSGDIVYTPIGSEYKAQLSDFQGEEAHTIGINFFLFDEAGESIILSDSITVFHLSNDRDMPLFFRQTLDPVTALPLLCNRILLMDILHRLALHTANLIPSKRIAPALQYLSENIEAPPSVAQMAALCNVSEVYFRKQFKKSMDTTPSQYRNSLRLKKAQSYLGYGDISVQEISAVLGYATVSHFIKEFKKHYGCSPLQYRKKLQL